MEDKQVMDAIFSRSTKRGEHIKQNRELEELKAVSNEEKISGGNFSKQLKDTNVGKHNIMIK